MKISLIITVIVTFAYAVSAMATDVNPRARFKGNFGLEAAVGSTPDRVGDTRPDGEVKYAARVYLRTGDANLAEGAEMEILSGFNATDQTVFRVLIRRSGGATFLNVEVRLDNDTFTGLSPGDQPVLSNGWNAVEVLWLAGAPGSAELYLNDTAAPILSNLDNGTTRVDVVRLGNVDGGGSSGAIFLDDFDSRKDTHIGLLCITAPEFSEIQADFPDIMNIQRMVEYMPHLCP